MADVEGAERPLQKRQKTAYSTPFQSYERTLICYSVRLIHEDEQQWVQSLEGFLDGLGNKDIPEARPSAECSRKPMYRLERNTRAAQPLLRFTDNPAS